MLKRDLIVWASCLPEASSHYRNRPGSLSQRQVFLRDVSTDGCWCTLATVRPQLKLAAVANVHQQPSVRRFTSEPMTLKK